jgi:hypothetical protein
LEIVLPVTVSGRLDTSGVPKPFHDFLPKLDRDDLRTKDGEKSSLTYFLRKKLGKF